MLGSGTWSSSTRAGLTCLLALLVFDCAAGPTSGLRAPGTVIDGFTIGVPWTCAPQRVPTDCDEFIRIARASVTNRGVDPDDIVVQNIYVEALTAGGALGGPSVAVVVFDLAEGSQVAAGAYCGVGPCQPVTR